MEFMEFKRVPTPDYRRKYSFDSTLSRSSTSSDPDDVVPSAIPSHLRPTRSVASLMVPSEVMKKHFHTLEIQEALNNTSTSARNTSSKAFSHSSSGTSVFFSFGESDQSGALIDPNGQILEKPNLRIFRFAELKKATKNFCPDTVLGEAVWGKVYKGWIDGKLVSASRNGSPKIAVAIKKTSGRWQGFRERQVSNWIS